MGAHMMEGNDSWKEHILLAISIGIEARQKGTTDHSSRQIITRRRILPEFTPATYVRMLQFIKHGTGTGTGTGTTQDRTMESWEATVILFTEQYDSVTIK